MSPIEKAAAAISACDDPMIQSMDYDKAARAAILAFLDGVDIGIIGSRGRVDFQSVANVLAVLRVQAVPE